MLRKKPISPEAAKLKMAGLCARSENCEHEIKEKLRKMGLFSDEINEILEFLIENRFIDNYRYAASFARDKVRFSGWGRNKIKQGLYLKRIPRDAINSACEEIKEEEYNEALYKVASSKARTLDLSDYDDKAKLYRYLISRGYESPLISRTIGRLIHESEE